MDFKLTDEQRDFVAAIRDFSEREAGTQEKREALTDGYETHHNFDVYKKMADLGWLGVTIPEEFGGSGGTYLDASLFLEETARGMCPIGGYGTTLIVAGATTALRHRRAEEEDPRRDRLGLRRGHRHDRARGRLRRRQPLHEGRAVLGQRGRLRHQRAEGVHLERPHLRPRPGRLPHLQGRVQARGPLDDLRPQGHPRDGDDPDRHHGRPRDQHRLLQRLRGARPSRSWARSTAAGSS